jgi:hypothetical protein
MEFAEMCFLTAVAKYRVFVEWRNPASPTVIKTLWF